MEITKGLLVRKPWIDLLLSGEKTWEMRSKPTKQRGKIFLLGVGTGQILGEIELIGCLPPLLKKERRVYKARHRVEDLDLLEKWPVPWVMQNPIKYSRPKYYDHPQGAVTWVNISGE